MQEEIRKRLDVLSPLKFSIIDDSAKHKSHFEGGADQGTHFRVKIVSAFFKGMSKIERHRTVFNLLEDLLKNKIHALSLTLLSDEE